MRLSTRELCPAPAAAAGAGSKSRERTVSVSHDPQLGQWAGSRLAAPVHQQRARHIGICTTARARAVRWTWRVHVGHEQGSAPAAHRGWERRRGTNVKLSASWNAYLRAFSMINDNRQTKRRRAERRHPRRTRPQLPASRPKPGGQGSRVQMDRNVNKYV
jgi:hypothetical protein